MLVKTHESLLISPREISTNYKADSDGEVDNLEVFKRRDKPSCWLC